MALLHIASRGNQIAHHLQLMARNKPAERLQLDALIDRMTGIDAAIRELENYQAWHRKHPQWEKWARSCRVSARRRRRSGKSDPG